MQVWIWRIELYRQAYSTDILSQHTGFLRFVIESGAGFPRRQISLVPYLKVIHPSHREMCITISNGIRASGDWFAYFVYDKDVVL